jgi:hypothetical protein
MSKGGTTGKLVSILAGTVLAFVLLALAMPVALHGLNDAAARVAPQHETVRVTTPAAQRLCDLATEMALDTTQGPLPRLELYRYLDAARTEEPSLQPATGTLRAWLDAHDRRLDAMSAAVVEGPVAWESRPLDIDVTWAILGSSLDAAARGDSVTADRRLLAAWVVAHADSSADDNLASQVDVLGVLRVEQPADGASWLARLDAEVDSTRERLRERVRATASERLATIRRDARDWRGHGASGDVEGLTRHVWEAPQILLEAEQARQIAREVERVERLRPCERLDAGLVAPRTMVWSVTHAATMPIQAHLEATADVERELALTRAVLARAEGRPIDDPCKMLQDERVEPDARTTIALVEHEAQMLGWHGRAASFTFRPKPRPTS